jgi:uncharacterized membrane protein
MQMPMKSLTQTFLTGLATVLPVAATAYLVIWLFDHAESWLGGWVKHWLPAETYLPGMGLALAVVAIFAVGVLMRLWLVRRLFAVWEKMLGSTPGLRFIYSTLKDLITHLSGHNRQEPRQVVAVDIPGVGRMVGFVTQRQLHAGLGNGGSRHVAVYLPLSYQIGGYTLLVPENRIEVLDMPVKEAMRFVLSAGLASERPDNALKSGSD